MKISQINQLNSLEYEVTLVSEDGIEILIVLEDTLVQMQLLKPQPISGLQYEQLKSDYAKAYRQAINYLSYRLRSCYEIQTYLTKKEHEPQQITQVIERLKAQKYLDDAIFAQAFVRTAWLDVKQGPQKVGRTMKQKYKIADDVKEEALELYSEEQQIENCQKLIQKLMRTNRKYVGKALEQQIRQKMHGYGYSMAIFQQALALEMADSEPDEVEDNEVMAQQAEKIYRRLSRESDIFKRRQKFQQKMYQLGFKSDITREWFEQKLLDDEE